MNRLVGALTETEDTGTTQQEPLLMSPGLSKTAFGWVATRALPPRAL